MSKIFKDINDLSYLQWSKIRHTSGTTGSYLKSTSIINGRKIYYKLSNYNDVDGIFGFESINELIVDRLLNIFEFDHLHYDLINCLISINGKSYYTFLCSSFDFKEKGEEKIAFDIYYDLEKEETETPLEFAKRVGFDSYIYEMFVIDFIILNRDRHGANIEVLRNPKKKTIRLAPLFDHGLSLLSPNYKKEDIINFDGMKDLPIQSYFGGNSSFENLKLIPKSKLPKIKPFNDEFKDIIFEDFDGVLDKNIIDKTWDIISNRWRYYESFCNKK